MSFFFTRILEYVWNKFDIYERDLQIHKLMRYLKQQVKIIYSNAA